MMLYTTIATATTAAAAAAATTTTTTTTTATTTTGKLYTPIPRHKELNKDNPHNVQRDGECSPQPVEQNLTHNVHTNKRSVIAASSYCQAPFSFGGSCHKYHFCRDM